MPITDQVATAPCTDCVQARRSTLEARFFQVEQPIQRESMIAVGWFAERDWMSIGKGLVSVQADENSRLASAKHNRFGTVP